MSIALTCSSWLDPVCLCSALLYYIHCPRLNPAADGCCQAFLRLYSASSVLNLLTVILPAGAIAAVWFMIPNKYNLKEVLPNVTAFVDTARAGSLPSYIQKDYPWLQSPSELSTETLTGGFYVGSDYVKYSLPIATSMTMLAWSLVSGVVMRGCGLPMLCSGYLQHTAREHGVGGRNS